MLKNQPKLELQKADGNKLVFNYVSGTNVDEAKDQHMHSLTMTMDDKDTMVQQWTAFNKGEPMEEVTTITLTRAQ